MAKRILYLQYTNPAVYPSLQHSARLLADRGWQVFFFGIRAVGTEAVHADPHPRIRVRLWSGGQRGWILKLHYLFFMLTALYWTRRWNADWLYVSDPEGCPAASFIQKFSRVRLLYHEHDSPTPHRGNRWMSFVYRCRRWVGQRAELCVLPNDDRRQHFEAEMSRSSNVFTVWNCPSVREIGPEHPTFSSVITVLYQGSLVPERFPLSMIDAIAQLPSLIKIEVVGYETIGHPGYIGRLHKRAVELNVADRVTISSGLVRTALVALGRRCDIGIAFQPNVPGDINTQFMVGASNKFYEYLSNGLALLISKTPGWHEAFVDTGYGLECDPADAKSIANALTWFLNHPDGRHAMGEKGRQKVIAEWNYEYQFREVLQRLEQA